MAIITHYTRTESGEFNKQVFTSYASPADFVVSQISDGVPFRCIRDGVEISQDIDAMCEDGEYSIIESAGKAVLNPFSSFNDPLGINRKIRDAIIPSQDIPESNRQGSSANNSLTDRTNKPRPYLRAYDICGTVQSIPSDLMQSYNIYDITNRQFQYGYYYVARGYVDTPVSGILEGDTIFSTISGSSAAIYDPQTSPNNSAPRLLIGDAITENLYIGIRSGAVTGTELRAPNEYELTIDGEGLVVNCELIGSVGSLIDASGSLKFDDLYTVGQSVILSGVKSGIAVLDGTYEIVAISGTSISLNVASNLVQWNKIVGGSDVMTASASAKVSPANINEVGFTDWATISTIKPERLLVNIVARQGMYKTPSGKSQTNSNSATAHLQWQYVDTAGDPVGVISSVFKTLTDKSRDEVGTSIIVDLPSQSAVRVRLRRSSNTDTKFNGTSIDTLTYNDLYGQIRDTTPNYGNLTTIHTKRKSTPQATSVSSPQLKVLSTEMLYKYLGNGVFDSVRTPNTQAVQSLIRLMRDPIVGNINMTTESMDDLLAIQDEIESYFGDVQAGQFCYTFDETNTTAQGMCDAIASAIFCKVYREGSDIKLFFEKPSQGPSMVFTHRSKIGSEKWGRSFGSNSKDSVEFTWIDPETNIRETIRIPENGGIDPNKIESKGVRNYQQAYWLAHRARQSDLLSRVSVEFTSTEEGLYVVAGDAISVVKGSRIASQDGYIVAQNGLTLHLSQPVSFSAGDDHFIQLKRRDGSVESIRVIAGANDKTVVMLSSPIEPIYTGNSAVKTEFSFGNEARHLAQMIIPTTIDPQGDRSVKITGRNYHPDLYLYDGVPASGKAFDSGFDAGFA